MDISIDGVGGCGIYRSCGHDRFAPFVLGWWVLIGLEIGPRTFREAEFIFGILVAASGCPAIGFFPGNIPLWLVILCLLIYTGPKALIPIANKPNCPW
jgi:hypothetical protein